MSDDFNFGMFSNFGGQDPLGGFNFGDIQRWFSWKGGPVNWDVAAQMAHKIAGSPRPVLGKLSAEQSWADAVLTADSWLAPYTPFYATGNAVLYSPQEWVAEAASPQGIARYVEPIASGMNKAFMANILPQLGDMGLGTPTKGPDGNDPLLPVSAMIIGAQVGSIAGHLANEFMGAWDLSIPTVNPTTVALIGSTAGDFASQYNLDMRELEFMLALRECAHRRVYGGVPWLLDHLTSELSLFGELSTFDIGDLQSMMDAQQSPMEALSGQGGMEGMQLPVERVPNADQDAVSERIQTLLALIYGYTEVIIDQASEHTIPGRQHIQRALRDYRQTKSAGQQQLLETMGLDFSLEDATIGRLFCDAIVRARGFGGLNRIWAAPEHLPTAHEVANPSVWLVRIAAEEMAAGVPLSEDDLPEVEMIIPDDLSELDDL